MDADGTETLTSDAGEGFATMEAGDTSLDVPECDADAAEPTTMDGDAVEYADADAAESSAVEEPGQEEEGVDRVRTFKIYIGNVPQDTEEEVIRKLFEEFGNVVQCSVEFGRALDIGRAFVYMEDDIEGKFAVAELQGREVNGKKLKISEARSHGKPRIPLVKLLVKNISPTVDARGLRNMFKRFGLVIEAQVTKGEGYVCLEAIADVRSALSEMNGFKIDEMELVVEPGPIIEAPVGPASTSEDRSPRKNTKGYNSNWNSSWSRARQEYYESEKYTSYQDQGWDQYSSWTNPGPSPWGGSQPDRILRDPRGGGGRRGGFGNQRGNMRMRPFPMMAPHGTFGGPPMGGGPMLDRVMRSGPPQRRPPRGGNHHYSREPQPNPFMEESYGEEVFYEDEPISAFSRSRNQTRMAASGANSIPIGGGPSWQRQPQRNGNARGGMGRGKPPKFTALNSDVSPGERYPVPPQENPGFRAPIKRSKDEGPIKRKVKKKKQPLVAAELPDYSQPVPDLPKPTVPRGAVLTPFPPPQGQSVIDSDTFGGGGSSRFFEGDLTDNNGQQMDFTTDDI